MLWLHNTYMQCLKSLCKIFTFPRLWNLPTLIEHLWLLSGNCSCMCLQFIWPFAISHDLYNNGLLPFFTGDFPMVFFNLYTNWIKQTAYFPELIYDSLSYRYILWALLLKISQNCLFQRNAIEYGSSHITARWHCSNLQPINMQTH